MGGLKSSGSSRSHRSVSDRWPPQSALLRPLRACTGLLAGRPLWPGPSLRTWAENRVCDRLAAHLVSDAVVVSYSCPGRVAGIDLL